jgi:hypothetical protein
MDAFKSLLKALATIGTGAGLLLWILGLLGL